MSRQILLGRAPTTSHPTLRGFAGGAPVPPEPALVPLTSTVPESGFLTVPPLTDWPPTLVTEIDGVAARVGVASRNTASAQPRSAPASSTRR